MMTGVIPLFKSLNSLLSLLPFATLIEPNLPIPGKRYLQANLFARLHLLKANPISKEKICNRVEE